jgi:cytochrome c oxidase cbb3-type subunit 3/ubiquinol-cytochrome c reductase cytochrome c subunit
MFIPKQAPWLAVTALILLATACEPPGKPGPQVDETAAPMEFKVIYETNCAGCHGSNGRQGPGRVLNDPLYLTIATPAILTQVIEHGRPGTSMPPWAKSEGGTLNDEQIAVLVSGIEMNWKKPFNAHGTTIPAYDGAGLTGDAANGKKLFARNCYACHAQGGIAGPINTGAYLSLSSNQNLRTSIIVGRPDFPKIPMPNYSILKGGHALQDQDIADLVSYLSSLRPASSAVAMAEMKNFQLGDHK